MAIHDCMQCYSIAGIHDATKKRQLDTDLATQVKKYTDIVILWYMTDLQDMNNRSLCINRTH